jgi:hypothetical protein
MTWANPNTPNLPDYILFVQKAMAIDPLYLPSNSPFFQWTFDKALALVIQIPYQRLRWAPAEHQGAAGADYTLAVYNCAGHLLLETAQDQPGRDYFNKTRADLGLNHFSAGVAASTSDQSTSTSLATPDALHQLTIGDLGFMRTLYGRAYLSFQQDFGGIFGLS